MWLPYFLSAKFSGSNNIDELARRLQSGQINTLGSAVLPEIKEEHSVKAKAKDAQEASDDDDEVRVITPPPRRPRFVAEGDDALSKLSVKDLRQMAKAENIKRFSTMNKPALVLALREKQAKLNESISPQINTPYHANTEDDPPMMEKEQSEDDERKETRPRSRTVSQPGAHQRLWNPSTSTSIHVGERC